jgi:circadian clock protein KaiB
VVLRLYVDDGSPFARRAIAELEVLRRQHLDDHADVEVIDVHEHPDVAEDLGLLALPTLVRVQPPPPRRIIGDLSDRDVVLAELELARAEEAS